MKIQANEKHFHYFFKVLIIAFFIFFNLYNSNISYATQLNVTNESVVENNVTENNIDIFADSCFLLEEKSGATLYEKNGYEKMYPASTTKLVTAMLVIEKCNLDEGGILK